MLIPIRHYAILQQERRRKKKIYRENPQHFDLFSKYLFEHKNCLKLVKHLSIMEIR